MSARTRAWVESWNRVRDLPEEELHDYLVKKCRNGFQMAKKPSRDQRDAWVTLLAEQNQMAPDKMVKVLQERNAFPEIQQEILTGKVLDWLELNAKIEEVAPAAPPPGA